MVELAGSYVQISPATWKEQRDVMVELRLGYGEQEKEAQKLLQMHTMFSQDPSLQPLYSPENRYSMMKSIMEAARHIECRRLPDATRSTATSAA